MKIGIDCRLWGETGVGRYIRNLVLHLQKLDNKNEYVLFILSKDRTEIVRQIQNDKFKLIEANIKWHTLAEQIKFPQVLNKENLDIVHFPYFSVPIFYNRPFVVTIHDLIINHFSTGRASTLAFPIYNLKLLAYKFVLSQASKKASKIIAVSNATKDEIIDHLKISKEKISVTYEGADEKILNVKNRKPEINGRYFLYVGNAYPHKNLERLLKAFETLNSDDKLVLVGKEDDFYKRLKQIAAGMNLSEKVIFKQNIGDEELSNLYKNAAAFVMPSLMEGFGLPMLEAMANNCLVLASNIPSLREICADAAIYFDPYNIKDIAEKMSKVYSDNMNNNSQKQKGLGRVKLFSWKKMAKETLEIYENSVNIT
jgi:glycosyltransferase involved in cell wall biosynthesis